MFHIWPIVAKEIIQMNRSYTWNKETYTSPVNPSLTAHHPV